jgi:hypothetical protein
MRAAAPAGIGERIHRGDADRAASDQRKALVRDLAAQHLTVDKSGTRFPLIYGREDDIVDPATQSEKLLTALKQAGLLRVHDRRAGRRPILSQRADRRTRQL